jgi:hypothetical protein
MPAEVSDRTRDRYECLRINDIPAFSYQPTA